MIVAFFMDEGGSEQTLKKRSSNLQVMRSLIVTQNLGLYYILT